MAELQSPAGIKNVIIDGKSLQLPQVIAVARFGAHVEIAPAASERMARSRGVIDEAASSGVKIYSVTTGYGENADILLTAEQALCKEMNLLRSHAAGGGEYLPEDVVRAIMLTTLNKFATGECGITPAIARTFADMLNARVYPCVPESGSLGASGDLIPCAHIALVVVGDESGQAFIKSGANLEIISGAAAMQKAGIAPVNPSFKDGLSMINGNTYSSGLLSIALYDSIVLMKSMLIIAALTADARGAAMEAFDPSLFEADRASGEAIVAAAISERLDGSGLTMARGHNEYSLRTMPQWHGAEYDDILSILPLLEAQINRCSDNPIVRPDATQRIDFQVKDAGKFQGSALAKNADILINSLTTLANISNMRAHHLMNDKMNGGRFPRFLAPDAGANSGLMIYQYRGSAEYLRLSSLGRFSVQSTATSAWTEDVVSNSGLACLYAWKASQWALPVAAIEMIAAAQAIDLINGQKQCSPKNQKLYQMIRARIPFLREDNISAYTLINAAADMIKAGQLLEQDQQW